MFSLKNAFAQRQTMDQKKNIQEKKAEKEKTVKNKRLSDITVVVRGSFRTNFFIFKYFFPFLICFLLFL